MEKPAKIEFSQGNQKKQQTKKLPYPDIFEENGYFYLNTEVSKGIWKPIRKGRAFKVDSININLDTKKTLYMLSHSYGTKIEYSLDPQYCVPEDLIKLGSYGFDIRYDNQKQAYMYLRNLLVNAPRNLSHSNLGFDQINGRDIFKFNNIIRKNKIINSLYSGELLFESNNTIDDFCKGFRLLMKGSLGLELSILIPAFAALNGYIGELIPLETIMFHIYGDSSSGKTTALKCASAFISKPIIKENSLIINWNGTKNAIVHKLGGNRGVLLAVDDDSSATIKNRANFVYTIAGNKEKTRLNGDLTQASSPTWQTALLSSGESSFLEPSEFVGGTKVRLIEFPNLQITRDAQHANDLNEFLNNNYGTMITPFVQTLMQIGKDRLKLRYDRQYKKITETMSAKDFGERKAKIFALILTSAYIINNTFNLGINILKIRNYLVELHNTSIEEDIAKQAFEKLKELVTINSTKFILANSGAKMMNHKRSYNETWGVINITPAYKEIAIIAVKCSEILMKEGFSNIVKIYNDWKINGWTECDLKCSTKKKSIGNGLRVRCIVFRIKSKKVKPFHD